MAAQQSKHKHSGMHAGNERIKTHAEPTLHNFFFFGKSDRRRSALLKAHSEFGRIEREVLCRLGLEGIAIVGIGGGERNVEFHHQLRHGGTEVHHCEVASDAAIWACERRVRGGRVQRGALPVLWGFDVPIEKGA